MINYIDKNIPKLKVVESGGTFLSWIDCRGLGMSAKELENFLINKACLGLSQGYEFGESGEGFVRMNIGCSLRVLKKALKHLELAVNELY